MANRVVLGDMKRVEARTIWAHEELDFTPWLYEHLDKLGEVLGLELEAEEREGEVGDFCADILARELGSNRLVVIENQLDATDHKHLGQLLTYAVGRSPSLSSQWLMSTTRVMRFCLCPLNESGAFHARSARRRWPLRSGVKVRRRLGPPVSADRSFGRRVSLLVHGWRGGGLRDRNGERLGRRG